MPYLSESLHHSRLYRLENEEMIRITNLSWGSVLAALPEVTKYQTHFLTTFPILLR